MKLVTGFKIAILISFLLLSIGMVSAIGDKIAFMSDSAGNFDIWVMDADGSNKVQLTTNPGWDGHPDWSPDGTKIMYVARTDWSYDIWVMDPDGSNKVQLTTEPGFEYAPDWSPDGSKIAFGADYDSDPDTRDDIWVMNADGTNPVRLTTDPEQDVNPSWSPDGTKIAFESYRGSQWEVWVMNADGTNQAQLTNDPVAAGGPEWSPDGTKIAFGSFFSNNCDVWVMDTDGSNLIQVTTHEYNDVDIGWSPDGKKIVYASYGYDDDWDIWVTDADGSNPPVQLTFDPSYDYSPTWFGIPNSFEDQIEDIQEYFGDAITSGALVGMGSTETSAAGKLNALENMLEQAEYLIDIGDIEGACAQLHSAYEKTDGVMPPPDFVTGSAAEELATMIQDLMDGLGCE